MNNLPIMPIRVQYADETANGKNIDAKFKEVDDAIASIVPFDPAALVGKFARVMPAPETTTLTDEYIDAMEDGVFINGTIGSYKDFIFFPWDEVGTYLQGICFANQDGRLDMLRYYINKETKVLSFSVVMLELNPAGIVKSGYAQLDGAFLNYPSINNKAFPAYPADTTKEYGLVQQIGGDLAFKELSGGTQLYMHKIKINNVFNYVYVVSKVSTPLSAKNNADASDIIMPLIYANGSYGNGFLCHLEDGDGLLSICVTYSWDGVSPNRDVKIYAFDDGSYTLQSITSIDSDDVTAL